MQLSHHHTLRRFAAVPLATITALAVMASAWLANCPSALTLG